MTDPARLADAIEAEAWSDLYASSPFGPSMRAARMHGATVFLAPQLKLSLFNRVIGLERADGLADILSACREIESLWIHLAPYAEPDLRPAIEKRGFRLASRANWAKVLRGTKPVPSFACSLPVRPIDKERATELARVLAIAHGMPAPMEKWLADLVGRPTWRAFGAFEGDRVVSGGYLWMNGEHAWLGMGGTLPSHRGRGAQRAVMAERVRAAIAAGCSTIATETGEPLAGEKNPSLSNMLGCGFEIVASRANYTRL